MSEYILQFSQVDKTKIDIVGGKGANLGELAKIKGINVPDGFCITTNTFKKIIKNIPSIDSNRIRESANNIRKSIEETPIPDDIRAEIAVMIDDKTAYAVRSSATAEDLPFASFAGQQDTYLNIVGKEEILKHVSKCWASLFTERAIIYRNQNGFDHSKVSLSVVIQKMVQSESSGIMFTADPITSNRKVLSIDASFGLGEAIVSGLVNTDVYKTRDNKIIDKKISHSKQVLTDNQILHLEQIGRVIEKHFGNPQDIEWCLVGETFHIVQSRPITTLYPVPESGDNENHVFVSTGHQQMMTDAMKPLGLSFFKMIAAGAHMKSAGGRLFVDITQQLSSSSGRNMLINVLGKSDPLSRDAFMTIIERDFIKLKPENEQAPPTRDFLAKVEYDPNLVSELISNSERSLRELKENIKSKTGSELFDFIKNDLDSLKKSLFDPRSFGVVMTGMNAQAWMNEKMMEWLGEKNVSDVLAQSLPDNITSEMGLALLDVADVIRNYPEVVDYLQKTNDDNFLDKLPKEARNAIEAFLDKYGMRCVGEIDITKTRWTEKPLMIVPMILSNIKNVEPNSGKRKFDEGLAKAQSKGKELLGKLKELPDGDQKVKEAKEMINLIRNYSGYREYPKYEKINRFFVYKLSLLKEAERLFKLEVIHEIDDIYYLTFEEFHEVVRTNTIDYHLINKRKAEFTAFQKLTPPRVITSDGEIITGKYNREDVPANAIVGLAVSSGIIEGRARVILNIDDAKLDEDSILVTSFTDPSWTPLFVSIKGLITEVGGLMTHGAVIAREYGLPAVVGVENATKLIKDGQMIRVNGTDGFVEIL